VIKIAMTADAVAKLIGKIEPSIVKGLSKKGIVQTANAFVKFYDKKISEEEMRAVAQEVDSRCKFDVFPRPSVCLLLGNFLSFESEKGNVFLINHVLPVERDLMSIQYRPPAMNKKKFIDFMNHVANIMSEDPESVEILEDSGDCYRPIENVVQLRTLISYLMLPSPVSKGIRFPGLSSGQLDEAGLAPYQPDKSEEETRTDMEFNDDITPDDIIYGRRPREDEDEC